MVAFRVKMIKDLAASSMEPRRGVKTAA